MRIDFGVCARAVGAAAVLLSVVGCTSNNKPSAAESAVGEAKKNEMMQKYQQQYRNHPTAGSPGQAPGYPGAMPR